MSPRLLRHGGPAHCRLLRCSSCPGSPFGKFSCRRRRAAASHNAGLLQHGQPQVHEGQPHAEQVLQLPPPSCCALYSPLCTFPTLQLARRLWWGVIGGTPCCFRRPGLRLPAGQRPKSCGPCSDSVHGCCAPPAAGDRRLRVPGGRGAVYAGLPPAHRGSSVLHGGEAGDPLPALLSVPAQPGSRRWQRSGRSTCLVGTPLAPVQMQVLSLGLCAKHLAD